MLTSPVLMETTARLVIGGGSMLARSKPVFIPAGMQSEPPHASPTGQHAVTELNTHVGWAASQVTLHKPTPADEKQAAPWGQHPEPSPQTVSVAWAQVN